MFVIRSLKIFNIISVELHNHIDFLPDEWTIDANGVGMFITIKS